MCLQETFLRSVARSSTPAALASKRELGPDYKSHLLKYAPALRTPLFQLDRAADWLESWLGGTLPAPDLLDVHARLGARTLSKPRHRTNVVAPSKGWCVGIETSFSGA